MEYTQSISPEINNISKLTEKDYITITLVQEKIIADVKLKNVVNFEIPIYMITEKSGIFYIKEKNCASFIKIIKTCNIYNFEYVYCSFRNKIEEILINDMKDYTNFQEGFLSFAENYLHYKKTKETDLQLYPLTIIEKLQGN